MESDNIKIRYYQWIDSVLLEIREEDMVVEEIFEGSGDDVYYGISEACAVLGESEKAEEGKELIWNGK